MNFEAIGTHWEIDMPAQKTSKLSSVVTDYITQFDDRYSRFKPTSSVSQCAIKAGEIQLVDNEFELIDLYHRLYGITEGAVTPLIGNTLVDLGYDAEYTLVPTETPRKALPWEEVISYNQQTLTVLQPALLDFGAAGKGYLVDGVAKLLKDNSVNEYTIDASGDIAYQSPKSEPLRVGLEHPADPSQVIGVAHVSSGKSICCSATNRRKWGNLHHIVNPHTAKPTSGITSVWVVADSTMLADGLATALFFTPAKTLQQHFDFQYVLVHDDYSYVHSNNFQGEIFVPAL